jgi:hypothetical protein
MRQIDEERLVRDNYPAYYFVAIETALVGGQALIVLIGLAWGKWSLVGSDLKEVTM